jgi:hypothetical protein
MNKLKPEIKELWLKALRSGEYTQFYKQLAKGSDEKSACCLGVLARELKEANLSSQFGFEYSVGVLYGLNAFDFVLSSAFPEEIFENFFETTDENFCKVQLELTSLNDGNLSSKNLEARIHSFYEIANWIDRNL